jgi:4-hydroxybenzoate polyprenyltransferase
MLVPMTADSPSQPDTARPGPFALLRAMRPIQWSKNVLLAVPIITGHAWHDPTRLINLLLAFVGFSLAASSVYLVNDVIDREDDRNHPVKRNRPIASGAVSVSIALFTAALLLGAAVVVGLRIHGWFLELMLAYVVIAMSYTLYFKTKPILDAIFLAGLYTHRIIIGGEATDLFPTPWLLAFSMFIFLSLALAKRHAELTLKELAGDKPSANRGYTHADIPMLAAAGLASGYSAVMVLALYINSKMGDPFYALPRLLWFICPLLIYWITRLWLLSNRGKLRDDPLMFTLTDRVSWLVGALAVATVVVATG